METHFVSGFISLFFLFIAEAPAGPVREGQKTDIPVKTAEETTD